MISPGISGAIQMADERSDRLARPYQGFDRERDEWLRRPRIHTEIFWHKKSIDSLWVTPEQSARRLQELSTIAKELGWSRKRLALFKRAIVEYRRKPTIESYLRVRRQFPEVEIHVDEFAKSDGLMTNEFRKQGINRDLVDGVVMAEEPAIDTLCLGLMERMVRREKISKNKPGHIQKRRAAISDAVVNYFIVRILESIHSMTVRKICIPASLVVLIRHQLTGINPDFHTANITRHRLYYLAYFIAERLQPNEKLSINKLASIAHVPRSTAARYLKNEEFQDWLAKNQLWHALKRMQKRP